MKLLFYSINILFYFMVYYFGGSDIYFYLNWLKKFSYIV